MAPLPKFRIDPGFGFSGAAAGQEGLRQPRQPQLLLRPPAAVEGDEQCLTSFPQRGKQTNKKFKIALNFHWKRPLLRASA